MIFPIIQIVIGVALIILVLSQQQSSGLGSAFGGGSEFFHTKRGIEKILFNLTIVLAIIFFALAIANVAGLV